MKRDTRDDLSRPISDVNGSIAARIVSDFDKRGFGIVLAPDGSLAIQDLAGSRQRPRSPPAQLMSAFGEHADAIGRELRRRSPSSERPLSGQERVEAAEGAGCEFHLGEPVGVSWIYAPGVNPNDPDLKLAEEAIEADRAGVEDFLRWRMAQRGRKP